MGSAARPTRRLISPDFDDQRRRAYLEALLHVLKELTRVVTWRQLEFCQDKYGRNQSPLAPASSLNLAH